MTKKIVLLSGPSGVGKGPLVEATKQKHPKLFGIVPVIRSYESRPNGPRPGKETEQWPDPRYFRSAAEIKSAESIYRWDCRGDPQGFDYAEIDRIKEPIALIEVYHTAAKAIRQDPRGLDATSVFLSPMSEDEVRCRGIDLKRDLTFFMRCKLDFRTLNYKVEEILTDKEIRANQERADSAYEELMSGLDRNHYDHFLTNHVGENRLEYWGKRRVVDGLEVRIEEDGTPRYEVMHLINQFREVLEQ
jgi:guanylate kinase